MSKKNYKIINEKCVPENSETIFPIINTAVPVNYQNSSFFLDKDFLLKIFYKQMGITEYNVSNRDQLSQYYLYKSKDVCEAFKDTIIPYNNENIRTPIHFHTYYKSIITLLEHGILTSRHLITYIIIPLDRVCNKFLEAVSILPSNTLLSVTPVTWLHRSQHYSNDRCRRVISAFLVRNKKIFDYNIECQTKLIEIITKIEIYFNRLLNKVNNINNQFFDDGDDQLPQNIFFNLINLLDKKQIIQTVSEIIKIQMMYIEFHQKKREYQLNKWVQELTKCVSELISDEIKTSYLKERYDELFFRIKYFYNIIAPERLRDAGFAERIAFRYTGKEQDLFEELSKKYNVNAAYIMHIDIDVHLNPIWRIYREKLEKLIDEGDKICKIDKNGYEKFSQSIINIQ